MERPMQRRSRTAHEGLESVDGGPPLAGGPSTSASGDPAVTGAGPEAAPVEQAKARAGARRARLALAAAITLALFAGWFFQGGGAAWLWPRLSGPASTGEVGQVAPEFTLESADGRPIGLSEQRGKVVLLNFWATWCVPCRSEMPEIESAYRANRDRGFEVLAVNVQEGAPEV